MKTRYSVNADGELVSRDGEILGRITSITVERKPAKSGEPVGTIGGVVVEEEEQRKKKEQTPITPRDKIWAHYESLFGTAYILNSTRQRIIDNALKVRSEEQCILAVTGLSRSPWHNGDNEQKKKYLDIRYALKGNSARGESNDERIDKMAALAHEQERTPSSMRIPDGVTEMERMRLRTALGQLEKYEADGDEEAMRYVIENAPVGFSPSKGDDGRWRFTRS